MDLGLDPETEARFREARDRDPRALERGCPPGCTMHPELWCGLEAPHHLHVCEPTLEQRRRALMWLEAFGRLEDGEERVLPLRRPA